MKKRTNLFKTIVAMVAIMTTTTSCSEKIKGEGEIMTREFEVATSTTGISVSNSIKLTLSSKVEPGELSIITYQNIHQYIRVTDANNKLTIELDNHNYTNLDIEVIASSKQYYSIEASGASKVTVEGSTTLFDDYKITLDGASKFSGNIEVSNSINMELSGASTFAGDAEAANSISLELSGASNISGDIVAEETLKIDASGSSDIDISGSSKSCIAELSGASTFYDSSFSCDDLSIDLSGASKVKIRVYESITGELSGSSKIQYKGSPSLSLDMSGSSSAESI